MRDVRWHKSKSLFKPAGYFVPKDPVQSFEPNAKKKGGKSGGNDKKVDWDTPKAPDTVFFPDWEADMETFQIKTRAKQPLQKPVIGWLAWAEIN